MVVAFETPRPSSVGISPSGAFFASLVLIPLWLQQNLGYTATWAGYATGIFGILAVVSAPLVGKLIERYDPRAIVFIGIVGLGLMMVWRMGFNSDVSFGHMVPPMLLSGPFMVMFFVPVTGLALASVNPSETANAAGLSNFMRTLAGAFATSLVQTGWSNAASRNQTELAGAMTHGSMVVDGAVASGTSPEMAVAGLDGMVQGQSVMLATLNMFGTIAIVFFFSAVLIWFVPKPKGPIDTTNTH
jgi:DHA2 family multidrug resistance protein